MKRHRSQTLSKSPICCVEQCKCCDQLHVNIGALTLRLEPEAFEALALSLQEACRNLKRSAAEPNAHVGLLS